MNQFANAAKKAIERHGATCTYKSRGTPTYDPATSQMTSTDTVSTIKAYPKPVDKTTDNYPALLTKQSYHFLILRSSVEVKVNDVITYDGQNYIIEMYKLHSALGEQVLYQALGVRG